MTVDFVILFLLIVLSAFFSGSEIARAAGRAAESAAIGGRESREER